MVKDKLSYKIQNPSYIGLSPMSTLAQVKSALSSLSKAESLVAEAILQNPEDIVNTTTAELATQAGVSNPMVSRFCKSLGYKSFPEFKVELAKSLATGQSYISESVHPDDDVNSYIEKRINANAAAIEYLRLKLQADTIEQAVIKLQNSKQISIFGMGGTASIAHDAQHKLFRLGIPTIAYTDHIMQRMAAAAADENTTILVFSFTGRTQTTIEIIEIAKRAGAKVIAITNPFSPLAEMADVLINSGDELEDTTVYVPMTTRIVILTIIDILVTGLALALGPSVEGQLKSIKYSLDGTKLSINQNRKRNTSL